MKKKDDILHTQTIILKHPNRKSLRFRDKFRIIFQVEMDEQTKTATLQKT